MLQLLDSGKSVVAAARNAEKAQQIFGEMGFREGAQSDSAKVCGPEKRNASGFADPGPALLAECAQSHDNFIGGTNACGPGRPGNQGECGHY